MLYLISYDLTKKPESEYEALIGALKEAGAVRILYSEWLLASDDKAKPICDLFSQHILPNDKLWVVEVTTNSAWRGVIAGGPDRDTLVELFQYARS